MKRCSQCGDSKPLSDFPRDKRASSGHRSNCKSCHSKSRRIYYEQHRDELLARNREWRQRNYDKYLLYARESGRRRRKEITEAQRKAKYGVSPEDYERMLLDQGGGCAICGDPPGERQLHVDHSHKDLTVRGILCARCNCGLGMFRNRTDLLGIAIRYLEREAVTG